MPWRTPGTPSRSPKSWRTCDGVRARTGVPGPWISSGGYDWSVENDHSVTGIPDVSSRELWKIVEERLRRSGAVPMKKR